MTYFTNNRAGAKQDAAGQQETENEYDDGFDEMYAEEETPEWSEEERLERRQSRVRLFFGAGNLFGIIVGTVLILLLLTLIFSMIYFVINDMGRNFSLFSTHF